jgi:hypothetical protein
LEAGYGATTAYNSLVIMLVISNKCNKFLCWSWARSNKCLWVNFLVKLVATNAYASNFFGTDAGYLATGASNSLVRILGRDAGAFDSNFMGQLLVIKQLGHLNQISLVVELGRSNKCLSSNLLVLMLVIDATDASNSNFFGQQAGNGATGASIQISLVLMLVKTQQVLNSQISGIIN